MRRIKAKIRVSKKSKRQVLFALTSLVILVTTFEIFNFVAKVNAKQVVISDNNLNLTYMTSEKNVESFLEDNNIVIGEYDRVNVALDETLSDGMVIEIKRAVPVNLNLNGTKTTIYTAENNVRDFLASQDIKLSPQDEINLLLDTLIIKNLDIEIKLYEYEEVILEEEVPYKTTYKNTSTLSKGETQIETEGKNGLEKVTYKIKYMNGKEVGREKVKSEVVTKPIDKVVLKGTLQTVTVSNGKKYKVKQILSMTATGYDNCYICTHKNPGDWGYGITASGMKTAPGVVAVDKSIIPLGTKLYVEGYGEAIAADTGSAIIGHKIDLYFETHQEAKQYGKHKDINVYVLAE